MVPHKRMVDKLWARGSRPREGKLKLPGTMVEDKDGHRTQVPPWCGFAHV